MNNIEFSFVIILGNYGDNTHYGPLFTRWLPDDDNDSISIKTDDQNTDLLVWFSRRGFVQNDEILFDYNKKEVDQEIMERQAVLEGGPLFGRLILNDILDEELLAMEKDIIDNPAYIKLGKRIYNLVEKPVSRLIRILQINFGQYWISDFPKWDSRHESIGSYCRNQLQLSWRKNPQSTWQNFCPNLSSTSISVTLPSESIFKQYISKEDYSQLQSILSSNYDPKIINTALLQAHANYDQGDFSYAIVDACTALEIGMSAHVRDFYKDSKVLEKAASGFFDQNKEGQLFFISLGIKDISFDTLELVIKGIKLRNRIVHDGYKLEQNNEVDKIIDAIFLVLSKLLPGPFFRFPTINPGNLIFP
jgi:hypothetical protein